VELRFAPAALEVSVGGQPVLVWNGGKQFIVEHLREKQEGDPEGWWAENFKSHHDSKPKGPTAISMDIQFPGSKHLYGIPEHAADLALRPTWGPEGALTEPYRLYNLDVFEYLHDSPFGLYGSIPLLIAHRPGGTSVGAFWLNAAEMYIDVTAGEAGSGSQWIAESGVLDLFVLLVRATASYLAASYPGCMAAHLAATCGWAGARLLPSYLLARLAILHWPACSAIMPQVTITTCHPASTRPLAGPHPRRRVAPVCRADGWHCAAAAVQPGLPPVPLELQGREGCGSGGRRL
jgi:hypothetical protein